MIKKGYIVIALFAIIRTSYSQHISGGKPEKKPDIVFGTIIDPQKQIQDSRKLARSLAVPGSTQ